MPVSESTESLKPLVELIVRALVDHPNQVRVSETRSPTNCLLEVSAAKEDLGRIIGKQGKTIQAIRNILNAASGKTHMRHVIDIIDEKADEPEKRSGNNNTGAENK
jgi:uncharacterized protein